MVVAVMPERPTVEFILFGEQPGQWAAGFFCFNGPRQLVRLLCHTKGNLNESQANINRIWTPFFSPGRLRGEENPL